MIETKRKRYISNIQLEHLFKDKYKELLDSNNPFSLNEVFKTEKYVLVYNVKTERYILFTEIEYREYVLKNKNTITFLDNSFFNHQLRGMIMAKEGVNAWTNEDLLKEFIRGVRLEKDKFEIKIGIK